MSLPTDWVVGDTGHAAAHNSLDTQVNANTTAIAGKLNLAGDNFTDGGAALISAMGLTGYVVCATGGVTCRLWVQTADPGASANDGDVWIAPVGS